MKNVFLLFSLCITLFSCSCKNDFDVIVSENWRQCSEDSYCIIDFANSMNFEWDTMCFYSGAFSLEEINSDLGFDLKDFSDIGDRVVFIYNGKVVYHKEWFPQSSKPLAGTVFITDQSKFRVTKSDAKFIITKVGSAFYLEKHSTFHD